METLIIINYTITNQLDELYEMINNKDIRMGEIVLSDNERESNICYINKWYYLTPSMYWIYKFHDIPPPNIIHKPTIATGTILVNRRKVVCNLSNFWKHFTGLNNVPKQFENMIDYKKYAIKTDCITIQNTSEIDKNKGYVYLIQRESQFNTNKYKIGRAENWNNRKSHEASYRNCKLYNLIFVNNFIECERDIIEYFELNYTYTDNDEHGSEDFMGDIKNIQIEFINICIKYL